MWRALGIVGCSLALVAVGAGPAPGSIAHTGSDAAQLPTSSLTSVPQLGGHRDAVLDVRQAGPGGNREMGITARAGGSGRELWSRTFAEPFGETIQLYPTVIGSPANHGLLAIDFYVTPSANPATQALVTRFRALSGNTGKVLWTQTLSGTLSADGDSSDVPYFDGLLTQTPSGVPGLLIEEDSRAGAKARTSSYLMSGSNGTLKTLGSIAAKVSLEPIPDANGDGYSDYVTILPGDGGSVSAWNLWGSPGPIWQTQVDSETAMTVQSIGTFGRTPSLLVEADQASGAHRLDVVSLKTGTVQWSRTAQGAFPIGKAGRSGSSAILLYAEDGAVSGASWTATLHYAAVSPANTVLYSKTVSAVVTPPPTTKSTGGVPTVAPIGDIEPDGARDFAAGITATAQSATATRAHTVSGIISGRLGRFMPVDFQEPADGSLHHGAGVDLMSSTTSHGHPQVTALRGSTGKRLYRRTYSNLRGWQSAWVTGAKVAGHSCSAIGLEAANARDGLAAMLDGRGDVLWTVTYAGDQAVGGHLVTRSAPKRFCP